MTTITGNANASAMRLLADASAAKPQAGIDNTLHATIRQGTLEKRLDEIGKRGTIEDPVHLRDIEDILQQSDMGRHILKNDKERLDSPTRAILFDHDGNAIGRVQEGGGVSIYSKDAHLFGGSEAFFKATSAVEGVEDRTRAMAKLGGANVARVVYIVPPDQPPKPQLKDEIVLSPKAQELLNASLAQLLEPQRDDEDAEHKTDVKTEA